MEKSIITNNIIKSNNVLAQYIAIVPAKESQFAAGKLVKVTSYDTTGRTTSISEYEAYADSTNTKFEYLYDNYISKVTTKASADNILSVSYSYDSLGRISSIHHSGSDRKDYLCEYDGTGNLVRKLGYQYYPKLDKSGNPIPNDSDKVLVDEIKMKYDKQNNLQEEIVKINGKLISKTNYKYNKNNLKTEEKSKYLGNTITYKYNYDDRMLLKSIERHNINGTKSYFVVEYDYYRNK